MQYLNAQWEASKTDVTRRGQVRSLIKSLHEEAGAQARAVRSVGPDGRLQPGKPLVDFMREMDKAEKFFRNEIGPIRDAFRARFGARYQTALDLQGHPDIPGSGVSPHEFYDWITHVVEHGDAKEIEGLKRMFGNSPRLQAALQNDVLHKMLMSAGPNKGGKGEFDPQKIADYIQKNRDGLQAVLGREKWEELQGFAKIAQRLVEQGKEGTKPHGGRIWGWSGYLAIIGIEHGVMGILEGQPHRIVEGVMLASSGFVAHTLYNLFSRVGDIRELLPVVRRIASMKPGPGMDAEISKMMMRVQARGAATGRVGDREMVH